MDLIKLSDLEPLEFRKRLEEIESEAILTKTRKKVGRLASLTGILSMLGSMVFPMAPAIAIALHLAATGHAIAATFIALIGGFIVPLCAGMAGMSRYLEPSDRLLLPHLFEPQAKGFFLANLERRDRLLADAAAYDNALGAFRALPAGAVADDADSGVVTNLTERRTGLETDIKRYYADFRAATEDDRRRVDAIEAARGKPKHPDKRRLAEFKERVGQLARLEQSLKALPETTEAGHTVDVSLFVAAHDFRARLEEEHAALVACGLKPKRLPPLSVDTDALTKFLPVSS